MSRTTLRRSLLALLVIPVMVLVVSVTGASADTSQASASAVNVLVGGTPILAASSASNNGSQSSQVAGFASSAFSILPSNAFFSDGRLGQLARAEADGTSSACAGLVSSSAALSLSAAGVCNATTNGSGIVVNLGPVQLVANVLSASCRTTSHGGATGQAVLGGARIQTPAVSLPWPLPSIPAVTLVNLALNPPANTGISAGGVDLLLNRQQFSGTSLTVTALAVTVAGTGVEIGKVTCGPNVAVTTTTTSTTTSTTSTTVPVTTSTTSTTVPATTSTTSTTVPATTSTTSTTVPATTSTTSTTVPATTSTTSTTVPATTSTTLPGTSSTTSTTVPGTTSTSTTLIPILPTVVPAPPTTGGGSTTSTSTPTSTSWTTTAPDSTTSSTTVVGETTTSVAGGSVQGIDTNRGGSGGGRSGGLARTGSAVEMPALVGLLLLSSGVAILRTRRRLTADGRI